MGLAIDEKRLVSKADMASDTEKVSKKLAHAYGITDTVDLTGLR